MKSGTARILTAAVGIPFVAGVTYVGGAVFAAVIAFAAVLAQLEFYDLQKKMGWNPSVWFGVGVALLILLRYEIGWSEPLLILAMLIALADLLRTGPDGNPLARLGGTALGVLYPVWLFSYLTDIRHSLSENLPVLEAFGLTMMLLILIWVADSAAYYVGKSIGKRKLAPTISPNKTWEGSIASIPGALVVTIVFKIFWLSWLGWIDVIMLAFIGGAWGQVGDLAESAFKRSAGIKDSASLLPGHGGMLDRIDSLVAAVPVYFLYLRYVMDVV